MDNPTVRVLVVEDSPSDAQLIRLALRQPHGTRFDVAVAERLDAAIALLREKKFDVALLDLGLPDSTGLATFTRVQALFPELPIIIMTGAGDDAAGVEAIRGGVQDYLVKGSVDAGSIARSIRHAVERKRIEEILRFLGQCGVGDSSGGFFQELARYLAQTLGMDFVCIDRLEGDRLSARTLAVFHNGRFEDNVSYTLKDTPCGEVVGKTICCFPRNVRGMFPRDSVLQDLQAESYLGTTLFSAQGQPIGLIAVIGRQPLADTRLAEWILQMVAVRAAGELERQQVEEELRQARQRLELAQRSAGAGVWDWDIPNARLVWSRELFELFGLDPDAAQATFDVWRRTLHPEDQDPASTRLEQAIRDGTMLASEYRVLLPSGQVRWISALGGAVYDQDRKPVRMSGICIDITARKRAELALKTLNDELEDRVAKRTEELTVAIERLRVETAERLRALEALGEKEDMLVQQSRRATMGEMIDNIAHQWRQPLNALGLTIQGLLMDYDAGEFSRELLDSSATRSMNLIKHMSQTIDDFRDFFRPDKEKTGFSVREAVSFALSLVEVNLRHQRIGVEIVANGDPAIHGYRNEFAQVLLNILNNARDVVLERGIVNPKVTITIGDENGRAVVSVADNAGGISEEIIGKIFDPYFTTKSSYAGTGIGLFMSKTIIEKNLGGTLTVRNTGEGAEFRIEV